MLKKMHKSQRLFQGPCASLRAADYTIALVLLLSTHSPPDESHNEVKKDKRSVVSVCLWLTFRCKGFCCSFCISDTKRRIRSHLVQAHRFAWFRGPILRVLFALLNWHEMTATSIFDCSPSLVHRCMRYSSRPNRPTFWYLEARHNNALNKRPKRDVDKVCPLKIPNTACL